MNDQAPSVVQLAKSKLQRMKEFKTEIRTIRAVLDYAGAELPVSEVDLRDRMITYSEDGVPADEARWLIAKELLTYIGFKNPDDLINEYRQRNALRNAIPIQSVDSKDEFTNIHGRVVREFNHENDDIAQTGILADKSAEATFTIWESSGVSPLDVDETYYFHSIAVDQYNGDIEFVVHSSTEILPAEEDLCLSVQEGAIVSILEPSGLIKRCDEKDCRRILRDGKCGDHGDVDGNYDIRVKAILDTGSYHETIYLPEPAVKKFAGMTKEEALELARKNISETIVLRRLRERLLGLYVHVEVKQISNGLWVEDGYPLARPNGNRISEIADQLRSLQI